MKFSIITVCFNSAEFIEFAIHSVYEQTYQDYEYVIIDGGSQDKTIEIIKKWEPKFNGRLRYISETDAGIYDAMNKGIQTARGEIIGFLNSDDSFSDEDVLASYAEVFSKNNCDAVYADLLYVGRQNGNQIQRVWKSAHMSFFRMYLGWHPAHPTFYVKKDIYNQFGTFNIRYKIAADYELMIRFIQKNRISCVYLPKTVVQMKAGGISNASLKNILISNQECWKAWAENGFSYNPLAIILKVVHKILQWVRGLLHKTAISR